MSASTVEIAAPAPLLHETESVASVTLRKDSLGLVGLTAQSVAGLAPSCSIAVPVVVVALISRNGAWLSWTISTVVMLAVAGSLALLSRRFVTAGGIYSMNAAGHPAYGMISAWAVLLNCLTGGATTPLLFGLLLQSLLADLGIASGRGMLLAIMIACTFTAGALAWRDTSVSARFVLAVEGLSLLAILSLVVVLLTHHWGHLIDHEQLSLRGVDAHQIFESIVLGLGAYGGFEAACSFGREAHAPQRQIAYSLLGSVAGAGVLFVLCAYVLALGFRGSDLATTHSGNAWADLALANGSNLLRYAVQLGVLISVFSMFVTNFNVYSRMFLTLSEERLLPRVMSYIDPRTRTPALAILCNVLFDVSVQVFLVFRGYATRSLYGLICALQGYWITVSYVLSCIAMLHCQRRAQQLRPWHVVVTAVGALPLMLSIVGSAIPLPSFPDNIAVILFAVSVGAVTLQLAYLVRYRPTLLGRIGMRIDDEQRGNPPAKLATPTEVAVRSMP
jgi:amino acid transporter